MGEAHLALLAEMLDLLRRYATTISRAELGRDRETWLKVRGALEVATQCCIDLALQEVSRRGLGAPQSYREAFGALARAGVVDAALARDMEDWAGLRNVLVHVYTTLDLDRIHAAIAETEALRRFHEAMARAVAEPLP